MIDASELREIHPIYCYTPKGDTVTFDSIKTLIERIAKVHFVPVAFELSEISSNNSGTVTIEDCLIIYHPKHRNNYINFVIRIRRDGDTAYISKNEYGTSSLLFNSDGLNEEDESLIAEKNTMNPCMQYLNF